MNTIPELHEAWCKASGQELNLRATERLFYDLQVAGFVADDITCVVLGMKRHNAKSTAQYKILAHKVCGDVEYFASLLADYRAKERNRIKPTPREKVLAAFRPTAGETMTGTTAPTVGDILKRIVQT